MGSPVAQASLKLYVVKDYLGLIFLLLLAFSFFTFHMKPRTTSSVWLISSEE